MADESRYVQGLTGSTPISDFTERFKHTLTKYIDKGGKDFIDWVEKSQGSTEKKAVWNRLDKRLPLTDPRLQAQVADLMPEFSFNQMTLEEFYKNIQESDMYNGMFEGLGRATIYADFNVPMPFNKFIEAPLEWGNAELSAVFTDLHSRPWIKNDSFTDTTTVEPRPLLFKTQVPEMLSSVARCEFSREIPLKINENEYKLFVQSGTMLGEVAGAMAGAVAYCYQRDMYEAAKEYFLGNIRIETEPETASTRPTKMDEDDLKDSPMVEIIEVESGKTMADECVVKQFHERLHKIVENEFYFPSSDYNPFNKETSTTTASVFMSSKYVYPLYSRLYADTYHPGELGFKMGPSLDHIWVDDIPKLTDGIYPDNYEMVAMVVDDRALGIIPTNPYSVGSFYNPQEMSNSLFAHYEFIFKYLPFFNRKYIFTKTKSNNAELKDSVTEKPSKRR